MATIKEAKEALGMALKICRNCTHNSKSRCLISEECIAEDYTCANFKEFFSGGGIAINPNGIKFNAIKPNVIKPDHYNSGKYDLIWFCQYHNISFDAGNIMKYVFRAGKKDKEKEVEDLKKAIEYINRRIEFIENAQK